jgi:hypothetical protein
LILLKNIVQVEHESLFHESILILLAKAKLEAQLELTRAQDLSNGNQTASDIMKRV